ncbi:hypothetical protein L6R49_15715 [Myxococcota bacterium]|nr:hypothetical protein [Myxococcota bacterium]
MRRALLPLLLLLGCDGDELVCEDGQHPVVDRCVDDLPPSVRYPDSGGADDTAGGDDSGADDTAGGGDSGAGGDSGGADSAGA